MKFNLFILLSLFIHILFLGLISLKAPQTISDFTVIEIGSVSSQERISNKPKTIKKSAPITKSEKVESPEAPAQNAESSSSPGGQLSHQSAENGSDIQVQAPRVIKESIAPYPKAAKNAGVEGVVEMQVTINTEGLVESAELIRGPGYGLNEAALQAIKSFVFSPASRQGEKVLAKIIYRYRFILGGS